MKKSFNIVRSMLSFALLLVISQKVTAASSCDLVIKNSSQSGDDLSFDIHSSMANLNPYKVTLSQVGKNVATWSNVPHASGQMLKVSGVSSVGMAIVRVESVKVKDCYAEKEIVISPDLTPNQGSSASCDFSIKDFSQNSTNLLFDLHSSKANINPYNVRIVKGSQELGNWKNVPHSSGQLLKVDAVATSGEATVYITSTKDASCSAQRVIKIEGQTSTEKVACKQGPQLLSISNISNSGLIAQFHGQDVFGIDFIIQTSAGAVVRNGSLNPTNNSPSVSFSALPQGKYILIFRGNTCAGESSKEFSITTGDVGSASAGSSGGSNGDSLAACTAGPEIKNISNISSSGLSAQFHGVNVQGIEFKILNSSGASVATGNLKPTTNTPNISFSSLGSGDYTLVFNGSTCAGSSQMTFRISGAPALPEGGSSGGTSGNGPTDNQTSGGASGGSTGGVLAACEAGPEIKEISAISPTSLVAQFHGKNVTGLDYVITNGTGGVAYSGSMIPKNSSPTISYTKLLPGSYTLTLKGSACEGQSSKAFTIPEPSTGSTSGGTPGGASGVQCTTTNTANFTEAISSGCSDNQRVTKTLMFITSGTEVWSDGGKNRSNRGFNSLRIPPAGVTLSDLPDMRYAMDEWEKLGGTSISIHLQWAATEPTPGHYIWDPLDWILDYAACKKMKVVIKIDTDGQSVYHTPDTDFTPDDCSGDEICPLMKGDHRAHRYMQGDEARKQDGGLTKDRTLSFSSDKWNSNVKNWLNKVAERVVQKSRQDTVLYAIMTSTSNQEFEYPEGGDFSGMEMIAWQQWQKARYGSVPHQGFPGGISGDGAGKDWFIFRTEQLQKTYKLLNQAFQSRGMKTVYDSGSFTDAAAPRNTWAVPFAVDKFGVDGLKQNPMPDYPNNLQAKLLACTGKYSSVEWTYLEKEGTNATNMAERIKVSIDNGVNDISFAFLGPHKEGDRWVMNPALLEMVRQVKASGHWDKKQQCSNSQNIIDIHLSEVLKRGSNEYKASELDSAISQKGRRNVCTRLNDDINLNLK